MNAHDRHSPVTHHFGTQRFCLQRADGIECEHNAILENLVAAQVNRQGVAQPDQQNQIFDAYIESCKAAREGILKSCAAQHNPLPHG